MLGSNVPLQGGFSTGFEFADRWGCKSIQIYTTPSRTWEVPKLSEDQVPEFKKAKQESSVERVIAHIPFLVNLASSDEELRRKSINRLVTEISRAEQLGVSSVVLHPGSHGDLTKQEGINRIISGLDEAVSEFGKLDVDILLETMAGQGTMLGSSFGEISRILEGLSFKDCFGVCFDTAHVFIAGYDIRGYTGFDKVMETFDEKVGISEIKAIHLNDSKTRMGSGADRHECIGDGHLGLNTFHALLLDERLEELPKILEIPKRDERSQEDLELLRELSKNREKSLDKMDDPRQSTLDKY